MKNPPKTTDLIINPEKLISRLTDLTEELCQISHIAEFANMAIKRSEECASESAEDVTFTYGEIHGLIGVMNSVVSRSQALIGETSDLRLNIEFPDLKQGLHREVKP